MKLNKIVLSICFSVVSMLSFAQVEVSMAEMKSDWKLIKQENGVEVYVSVMECKMGNVKEPFLYGSVKVVNTTSEQRKIDFTYELHYADGCSGCGVSDEYSKNIIVDANSEIVGACDFKRSELTILLVNPLQTEKTELNKLIINNFKIN